MLGANGKLVAAQVEGEEKNDSRLSQNVFSKLQSESHNPKSLRSFFVTFKKVYYQFYGSESAWKLVWETLALSDHLFGLLLTAAISGDLSHLFKSLDKF